MSKQKIESFLVQLKEFYSINARDKMPWRQAEVDGSFDAYKILVSEVMLQQTQVSRVTSKYLEFLGQFPSVDLLANAKLSQVLQVWSGLGYNRRAKFLHQSAKTITGEYGGAVPQNIEQLQALPGIGYNTAAAICTYSSNQPHVFVETNIRTVFIFHFFKNKLEVSDKEITELLGTCLEVNKAMTYRDFYWGLMDYGAFLKRNRVISITRSKHYVKQSTFAGSLRQVRGEILRQLMAGAKTTTELKKIISDNRLQQVLQDLQSDRLITKIQRTWQLQD